MMPTLVDTTQPRSNRLIPVRTPRGPVSLTDLRIFLAVGPRRHGNARTA